VWRGRSKKFGFIYVRWSSGKDYFDAGTQFPGSEKITLCNTKSTIIIIIIILNLSPSAQSRRQEN